jgi:O-antigen ligase
LGYYANKVNINDVYNTLTNNLFGIHQHPIYGSIFISIALFFGFQELKNRKNIYLKIILFCGVLFMFYILFLLSRKGIILGFIGSLLAGVFIRLKKISLKKTTLISILAILGVSLLTPVLKTRFKEVFHETTYKEINSNNSSSIRYGVYNCVTKVIKNNWWFGYGIGDVQDELLKCYKNESKILVDGNYNSHNQYFSYTLSSGVIGAFFLISILISTILVGIKNNKSIIVFIITFYSIALLFENILERQSGIILFMFFLSYFNFKNYLKIEE